MQWTMSRPVLRVVAGGLVVVALGAFTMGVINAPQRGRLPGERAQRGAASPIATEAAATAPDATPLSQDRIEGPPAPPELTPQEKAKQESDRQAKAEAAAAARQAAAQAPPPPPTPTPTLQTAEPPSSPAEEAPH